MSHPSSYEIALLQSQRSSQHGDLFNYAYVDPVKPRMEADRRRRAAMSQDERDAEDAEIERVEAERKAESDRQGAQYGYF